MIKIVITGANGMFGSEAADLFEKSGYDVVRADKSVLDVTNLSLVEDFFKQCGKVDFVIHAAAYTKVDDAENNQELAFLVNSVGAKNIAKVTAQKGAPIFYISTDYVFDGKKGSPYVVSDRTNPLNVYGASKLAGEGNVQKENPAHYIVRTSWLYGKNGKNFVDTMLNISKTQNVIKVVSDQFGCPTWTIDLFDGIKKIIEKKLPFGTYHICGSGVTSWYEFAKKIFEISQIKVDVLPVSTSEFFRPAKRPEFSAMDNSGFCDSWENSLKRYLKSKI